tara:strand:+ start:675 stop:1049 length:375 start_codon:yes stop_codon:yes gene_type:complete
MSELKLCQGPKCHTYNTKDRLKGMKDNKTYQTRRRSSMYYGSGNFCSMHCYNDWAHEFIDRAVDHFGRLTEPKHLNENNAWQKTYDWDNRTDDRVYVYRNGITKEERPLTEEQYDDNNYTLNER